MFKESPLIATLKSCSRMLAAPVGRFTLLKLVAGGVCPPQHHVPDTQRCLRERHHKTHFLAASWTLPINATSQYSAERVTLTLRRQQKEANLLLKQSVGVCIMYRRSVPHRPFLICEFLP